MNAKRLLTPMALVLAMAMSAAPLVADEGQKTKRRQESGSAWSSAGRARGESPRERAGPARQRSEARSDRSENRGGPPVASAPADRNNGRRAVPRAEASRGDERRGNDARAGDRGYDTRAYDNRRYDTRAYDSRRYDAPRYEPRRDEPRRYPNAYAVPRGRSAYVYGPPRHRDYRYDGRYYYGSWYSRQPFVVGRYYPAYRPGWTVRFGLGYSVYAGSPFAFRFSYGYAPVHGYPYAVRAGVAYGGMSFLIDPDEAEVYVDGVFIGRAYEFGGQPVPVGAGYHRVEIYAPGFEGVVYDVNVLPGQVIPYRGSLVPAYR